MAYPEAVGLWFCFVQNFIGLHALGHDAFWIEIFYSSGDTAKDEQLREIFLRRMAEHGLHDRTIVLQYPTKRWEHSLEEATVYGRSVAEVKEILESADLVWNFSYALRPPLLMSIRRRVLLDGDPGLTQVSALSWNMGQADHQIFMTVGAKLQDPDCLVPDLGLHWQRVLPVLYMPLWKVTPDPGPAAPITSVTQWNWREIWEDPEKSISKRTAYLRYLDLPRRCVNKFELAANIHPNDDTGDRELLKSHGWQLVHPDDVAGTPASYVNYVQRSRAELCCPKPIYCRLKTGWLSDRSATYLALGRPVLMEETGFSDHYPTGTGLLTFRNMDEAVALVQEVDGNYAHHSRAAREFAEEYLDSSRCLERMISACA